MKTQETEITHATPLWIACRTLLAQQGENFFSHWKKAAKDFDEEEVHDLRVASRRLREGLALFSPCLPPKQRKDLGKRVKKVTRMMGELRNTDEAFLFFSSLTPEETARSRQEVEDLLALLKDEREQAHKQLEEDLSSLKRAPFRHELLSMGDQLNLFQKNPADPFAQTGAFAARAIMERAQPVGELLPRAMDEEDSAAQHQLRIAVKKLRYRLEIMEPLLGSDYHGIHDALKGYQDVLGKLHDIDVFAQMVQERLPEGTGRDELLEAMSLRRSKLHATFLKKLKGYPLESVGEKARDAL